MYIYANLVKKMPKTDPAPKQETAQSGITDRKVADWSEDNRNKIQMFANVSITF